MSNNLWFKENRLTGGPLWFNFNCSSPSLPEVCCNTGYTNDEGHPTCPSSYTNPIALGSDPCPYTYNHTDYQCGAIIDTFPMVTCYRCNAFNELVSQESEGECISDMWSLEPPDCSENSNNGNDDIYGCTSSAAFNYNPDATIDDGSCQKVVQGCTDPLATNYMEVANTDDGSCEFDSNGTDNGGTETGAFTNICYKCEDGVKTTLNYESEVEGECPEGYTADENINCEDESSGNGDENGENGENGDENGFDYDDDVVVDTPVEAGMSGTQMLVIGAIVLLLYHAYTKKII